MERLELLEYRGPMMLACLWRVFSFQIILGLELSRFLNIKFHFVIKKNSFLWGKEAPGFSSLLFLKKKKTKFLGKLI